MSIVLLFSGLSLLIIGSHFLINSLTKLSVYFSLSPLFLSIVVLGFVSSSPEWFVTTVSLLKDSSNAALGNILGSNVINILLVLGLTGLASNIQINRQVVNRDMPFLVASCLLLSLFFINQTLDFLEATCFLAVFSIYLILLFKKRKNEHSNFFLSEAKGKQTKKRFFLLQTIFLLLLGFVILFIGSKLAVDSALKLAYDLSLSDRFAGVFILSVGTSLPELATSLQAALKKQEEMALGNIVGSNIFNTLFVLGSASLLKPLYFSFDLLPDYLFMLLVSASLWLILLRCKNIPKIVLTVFVLSYFVYIGFVSEVF